MAADSSITGYKCRRVNNGGGPVVAVPQTAAPGTVASTSATSATAAMLKMPFQRTGKWYNGKMFIVGLAESMLTGNAITGALPGTVGIFAQALLDGFTETPHTWQFVIWSRTVSLPFIPFNITLNSKVGIQRRRLRPVM